MAQSISPGILQAALAGLRLQEQKIQEQIAEVEAMLDGNSDTPSTAAASPTGKRRKFSAAARRHMKEAQRRRWAAMKGTAEQPEAAAPVVAKAKRKLTAAGRKSLQESMRRRWAVKKAEAKSAQGKTSATKKVSASKSRAKAKGKKVAPTDKAV